MKAPVSALGAAEHQSFGVDGPFAVEQEHDIIGALQLARDELEAAGSRFATDAIRDARLRQLYKTNIQRISREVQAEVDAGRVSVVQGARFCQRMRNRIMKEARIASSAQGRKYAESKKQKPRTLRWLLDKYAEEHFQRPFSALSDGEKSRIFYAVVESAGRDRVAVTAATRRLWVLGKVGVIVTAILGVHAVLVAEDKPREAVRQVSVIGGGLAGGALAGAWVAVPLCGPGAVLCAVAVVLLGSVAGSLVAEQIERTAEDELQEFSRWNVR